MKEKIDWNGKIYETEWVDSEKIPNLKNVTQVYGFLFDRKNKLCIVNPKRDWRLPGGKPEKGENWKDTLVRESEEEADVELEENSLKLIGYLKISPISKNCEKGIHYQLRAIGKIKKVNKQTIDIAENLISERKFIEPKDFLEYCKWGKLGEIQIKKAITS